jgi:hypothetical protein
VKRDDEVELAISADRHVDTSICSEADYRRWRRGEKREFTLSFLPPRNGDYLLLLINYAKREVDVEMEALVWPE